MNEKSDLFFRIFIYPYSQWKLSIEISRKSFFISELFFSTENFNFAGDFPITHLIHKYKTLNIYEMSINYE